MSVFIIIIIIIILLFLFFYNIQLIRMSESQLFKRKMLMELIFNPLGFHCFLRDKTYKEATRQVGTSLDFRVSIGVPNT